MYAQACGVVTCQKSISHCRQQRNVFAILVVLLHGQSRCTSLNPTVQKKDFANNILAKFKEHELEPRELAKKELQSFTKSDDADELPSKKARETKR